MIAEVQEAGRKQSVSDEAARKAQWSQDSSLIDINVADGGCKPAGRTQSNVEKTVVCCKGGLSLRGPSEFRSGFDSRHYHKHWRERDAPMRVQNS